MQVPKRNVSMERAEQAAEEKALRLKTGLTLTAKPKAQRHPDVPYELTDLDDPDLMSLFSELVQWQNYYAGRLAVAEIDENAAETLMEKAKALALLRSRADHTASKDDSVTIAKAAAAVDEEVERRKLTYDTAYNVRKYLAVFFNDCDRLAALVSRELTRRTGNRDDRSKREQRWTP